VFAIARDQFCPGQFGRRSNQRIAQLEVVGTAELTQVFSGFATLAKNDFSSSKPPAKLVQIFSGFATDGFIHFQECEKTALAPFACL